MQREGGGLPVCAIRRRTSPCTNPGQHSLNLNTFSQSLYVIIYIVRVRVGVHWDPTDFLTRNTSL